MIEVYRQPKLRKFRQIAIVLSVLFLIGGIYILLFQESNEYSLFTIIYPIFMFLEIYYNQYYPYITLTNNCLTKRPFLKKYKIQLDEVEYIKNVFGDIQFIPSRNQFDTGIMPRDIRKSIKNEMNLLSKFKYDSAKGPDKIIQIEKDVVSSEDMQQILEQLKTKTELKTV